MLVIFMFDSTKSEKLPGKFVGLTIILTFLALFLQIFSFILWEKTQEWVISQTDLSAFIEETDE